MIGFILVALVIAVVAGAGAVVVARKTGASYAASNEIVPGVPTRAPAAWAGAHSTEARLHRRMRDAMAAVRANRELDEPAMLDARVTLEQHTLALDDRLVAVAALAPGPRASRMADIESGVVAIEEAVAQLVDLRGARPAEIEAGLAAVRTRVALVAEARAELDAIDPTSSSFEAMRDQIEATSPPPLDGADSTPPAPPGTESDEGPTATG